MKNVKSKKDQQIDVIQNLMTICSLMIEAIDAVEDSRHWINVLKNRANSLRKECERITGSLYLKYMADNAEIDQYHSDTINLFDTHIKQMVKMSRSELMIAHNVLETVESGNYVFTDSEDLQHKKIVISAVKNYGLLLSSLPSDYPELSKKAHQEIQTLATQTITGNGSTTN